jgi:hypothetical protein
MSNKKKPEPTADVTATETEDEILIDKSIDPIGKVFKFLNQDDTFTHWMFVDKGPSKENPGNEDYTVYHMEGNVTDTVDVKAFHEYILEFAMAVDYVPVEEYVKKKEEIAASANPIK